MTVSDRRPNAARMALGQRADGGEMRPSGASNRTRGAATAAMSAERRVLLADLLRRRRTCPLSFPQEQIWLLENLSPGTSANLISLAFRLRGSLDVDALRRSLREIVRRHEALRTSVELDEQGPVQAIRPPEAFDVSMKSLDDLPEPELEEQLQRLATEEMSRPFDLSSDALLRATVVRAGADDHALFITLHRLGADGWSVGLIFRELSTLYDCFSRDRPSFLPELPMQYRDFALWQRERLRGDVLAAQLAYWKDRLAGMPASPRLPVDRPRPEVPTPESARVFIPLSPSFVESLERLGRTAGATLFMTLLASFKALLHRWTGETDVVVSCPTATNRDRNGTEGLIGCFANVLILRTDLSGDPSLRDLLARLRESVLGAFAHQDVPVLQLIEELQGEVDLAGLRPLQVMFTVSTPPVSTLELRDVELDLIRAERRVSKLDLMFSVREWAGETSAVIEYSTDLFDHTTAESLAAFWRRILDDLVTVPGTRLSQLPLPEMLERQAARAKAAAGEGGDAGT
jgi:fengycin family lipopeptide synthetase B